MSTFDVPGVRIGHWTAARTGVTVVLFPSDTVGSCEVRGGAPASRETALLDPTRTVERVDAITLTGGSAFGLAAGDGAMRYLAEHDQGFPTAGGVVPIVPTAAIFDLLEGEERPGADAGYAAAAAAAAQTGPHRDRGSIGAGRGATVGKWRGRAFAAPGGLGLASTRVDDAHVGAIAVVNAVGDVVDSNGAVLAGSSAPAGTPGFPTDRAFEESGNTTLVVVATDGRCDKLGCHLLAQSAHDGVARSLLPAHTRFDGDLTFAVATGGVDAHFDRLREAAAFCAAAAIRNAVLPG